MALTLRQERISSNARNESFFEHIKLIKVHFKSIINSTS
jgi:hypothetical protein